MKYNILRNIQIIIWDFDGTFYRPNKKLFGAVREAEYKSIMHHTGWTRNKAIKNFNRIYKKKLQSATQTVGFLTNQTTSQSAREMERYFDRREYVKRDKKLPDFFNKLKSYRHLILANGTRRAIRQTLLHLGVNPSKFEDIVTSEVVGENKPSEKGYRYILKKTGLKPSQYLVVGDREAVDIVPAKKLGMRTCLVHSAKKSLVADITLNNLYNIESLVKNDQGKKFLGKFIVFEGVSGTGKDTQALLLQKHLQKNKIKVHIISHPTIGLKAILSAWRKSREVDHITESFFIFADRHNIVKHEIIPALKKGEWVISLRGYVSTLVYQGKKEIDRKWILEEYSRFEPDADIIFYFDISPEVALKRLKKRHQETGEPYGTFEKLDRLRKKCSLFDKIFEDIKHVRIDASKTIKGVSKEIIKRINI